MKRTLLIASAACALLVTASLANAASPGRIHTDAKSDVVLVGHDDDDSGYHRNRHGRRHSGLAIVLGDGDGQGRHHRRYRNHDDDDNGHGHHRRYRNNHDDNNSGVSIRLGGGRHHRRHHDE